MRRYKWDLLVAAAALCLVAVSLYFSGELHFGTQPPREKPVHALYVWQRAWTDDVRASVAQSTGHVAHLMVLAHEDGMPPIDVDWQALADTKLPVTPVFRFPESLRTEIEADSLKAARRVSDLVFATCDAMRLKGLGVAGVQLDYDAPTSSLENYGILLRRLQRIFPPTATLSITALPTWLGDPAFPGIASALDYYVLQVHSFERPGSIDAPMVLCDTTRIADYVAQAEDIDAPYFIAFPTHGYEAAFDRGGNFVGLSAEGPDPAWPDGAQLREVRADPAAIAGVVNALAADLPSHFRGAVWFRMPVASDTRNWTWPVLAAVMEGRVPSVRFATEIRNPDPGLAEIWLSSIGEDRPNRTVEIQVSLSEGDVLASDCVNGFTANTGGDAVILRGPAPVDKAPILVGWYRMKDEGAALGLRVLDTVNAERSTARKGAG